MSWFSQVTIKEIERHLHNNEDWLGLADAPNAEIHRADNIASAGTTASFQIDAGNDAWGAWVQILGSSDTPVRAGKTKFDLHKLQFVASETTNKSCFVQLAFGETAADALAAGKYTTVPYLTPTVLSSESPVEVMARRYAAGTKVWARTLCIATNTHTLNFYIGIHEYDE